MATTCPHCQTHFPNSDTVNSRHKAVCDGWRELLGDTKPHVCLCGHESRLGLEARMTFKPQQQSV